MEFKNILRARRKALGLTQQDVGDWFGIKSVNISDWERGEGMPEASKLKLLAKKLDLTVSELLGEKASKHLIDQSSQNYDDILQLITLYNNASDSGRIDIIDFATGVDQAKPILGR